MLLQTKIACDETVTVPKIQDQRRLTSTNQLKEVTLMRFYSRALTSTAQMPSDVIHTAIPHWSLQTVHLNVAYCIHVERASFNKVVKILALLAHVAWRSHLKPHPPEAGLCSAPADFIQGHTSQLHFHYQMMQGSTSSSPKWSAAHTQAAVPVERVMTELLRHQRLQNRQRETPAHSSCSPGRLIFKLIANLKSESCRDKLYSRDAVRNFRDIKTGLTIED